MRRGTKNTQEKTRKKSETHATWKFILKKNKKGVWELEHQDRIVDTESSFLIELEMNGMFRLNTGINRLIHAIWPLVHGIIQ